MWIMAGFQNPCHLPRVTVTFNLPHGCHLPVRKMLPDRCSARMMADTESFCPGGAEAATGQGRASCSSFSTTRNASLACIVLSDTAPCFLVTFFFLFFSPDFIFGLDMAADLQVAAGIWNHHLPSLFHWTQLSTAGHLTRMIFLRVYQSRDFGDARPIKRASLSRHGSLRDE